MLPCSPCEQVRTDWPCSESTAATAHPRTASPRTRHRLRTPGHAMDNQSPEVAHGATEPPEPAFEEPTTAAVDGSRPSPEMALNAATRQLAQVNAALTELQVASERSETTVLMLERINA